MNEQEDKIMYELQNIYKAVVTHKFSDRIP